MTTTMDRLLRSDFVRFPTQAATRSLPFKEWHHFVVQRSDLRLVINFSLQVEGTGPNRRVAPRTIVLAHASRNAADIDECGPCDFGISPDFRSLRVGGSHMWITEAGYRVLIGPTDARGGDRAVRADLHFVPTSTPFIVNNQPVGAGRLSWLFVPQMTVSGWFASSVDVFEFDEAIAYHDHNWGHLRWGDDFSWMWGSVLPPTPDGITVVAMRMTDRAGHRAHSQALYVWEASEPIALFRDAQLAIDAGSPLARPPTAHLPPITRMLSSAATDVPTELAIRAVRDGDRCSVDFESGRFTRIGFADEMTTDRICLLDEASGRARVSGSIGGHDLAQDAAGFFEFCHG